MRLNTIITLGASIVFGLGGVLLARGWINSAIENEFREVATNEPQQPVAIETVPILVADVDLDFGDVLSRDAVRIVNYPADAVPNGSFSNIETIFESEHERIVLSPLAFNEPILDHKIVGPNGKASLSARITSGYRAVSIRVDDVSGVAGFVVPGDVVDIIYTREPEAAANGRQTKQQASSTYISDIILQNITVLGVNQNHSQATSDAIVARTVTLEVSNEDGQALNLAMKHGTLSLSLRGVGETVPSLTRQMQLSDLGVKKAHRKTPHKARTSVEPVVKKAPSTVSQVTIIRLREDASETVERLSVKKEQTPDTIANQSSELAGG